MVSYASFGNWITVYSPLPVIKLFRTSSNIRFKKDYGCGFPNQIFCLGQKKEGVHYDSLRVLEWDKLCDLVSSFAGTSLGREATKVQLWSLERTYEESLRLLQETNAAVEMHKHGACRLDFTGIDLLLVKSAIQNARRGLPISANEAMAVAAKLESVDVLKLNLEATIKEDADCDSGRGSILEPLSAVPLNDDLQRGRASVAKAEADVLLMLTEKMQKDLDDIEKVLNSVTQLDVINARATYSLSYGGACPDFYPPEDMEGFFSAEALEKKASEASYPLKREWMLYVPKAYHPLLLQQHRQNLEKARKDAKNATTRKLQANNGTWKGETDVDVSSLEMQVSVLEQSHPVPVDFFISRKTKVLVITGPNTGGKTICLKTLGLAAMMAKAGLHVLSSESVQLPWFDYILADIGDEQSLSQSLSTFSGHLKQISAIRSQSTNWSLVLLDEVGAGTNPLEGAALGMSLLESFADSGALLTVATTHHGELKSLKYSNGTFENACMEFDEVNLKPTYKILWGVPGRSNAINISEKLGLPGMVISNARELYGAASAEINEVIIDMERFKQDFQEHLREAQHHLMLSKNLHEKLLLARRKIMEHGSNQRYRKLQEISEVAAMSRSILHKKVRHLRAYLAKTSQAHAANKRQILASDQHTTADNSGHTAANRSLSAVEIKKQSVSVKRTELPQVGDSVQVSSLRRKATVIKVDQSKEEILVQAGNMKLKLKLTDLET